MTEPKQNLLQVIARAPFDVYYEGPAEVVSATNRIGEFDILPDHADFFSILTPGEIAIMTPKQAEPIIVEISNGMVTVQDNNVMLFLNI